MLDVLTMGRIGVDVYPLQTGVSLREVETFGKYLGGSPTNVAVAAARHGRSAAVITRTGADPFGEFLHDALRRFGVDDRYVSAVPGLPTPVTFCEIFPPDDFPLYFYREPKAPDLEIRPEELDLDAIRAAKVFWVTVTGLSQEPSRAATLAALEARGRDGITVLDLDYRPMFWPDPGEARAQVARALEHVTVAVGNQEECEVAVGERDPRAAAAALHAARDRARDRQAGPEGRARRRRRALGRGPAAARRRRQRPRRRRRVRRRAVPCAARRLGARTGDALLQRCGGDRRLAAGLRRRDARRGGGPVQARGGRECVRTGCGRWWRPGSGSPRRSRRPRPRASRPARPVDEDGRAMIVAADHPPRGFLGPATRPLAMADRADLLDRLCLALSRPGVTGVLGTPDIVEDLLLLGALEGKVVFGSMNRGGLAGATWELDDRFTAYDAASIERMGYEGGKMLTRIDLEDPATAGTVEACALAPSATSPTAAWSR